MPTPPATGIVSPEVALRPGRVVAEGVDHHLHLAARVADRLAGVARLEHRQRLELVRPARRPAGAAARARSPRRDRAPGRVGRLGAGDRRVRLLRARARDLGQDLPRWRARGPRACRSRLRPATSSSSSVDRRCRGPLNVFFALTSHQIPTIDEQAAGDHRGVVDERPVELVAPTARRTELNGRMKPMTVTIEHLRSTANEAHPLVLLAERPRPGLEPVAHPPAQVRSGSRRRCRGRSPRSRRPR